MVAKIASFDTRADIGLRNPRSFSRNITPQRGGCAVHWGGPRQTLGDHARCRTTLRSWQNYHMNTHGWADLAYTGGFCNHGVAMAIRGHGVRTAANGTNDGNQNYHAYVWVGGSGNSITQAAYDALDWWILQGRRNGAGNRVRPHTDFTGSACPGNLLTTYARSRDNKIISTPAPASTPTPTPTPVPTTEEDEVKLKQGDEGNDVAAVQRGVRNWMLSRPGATETELNGTRIPNANGKWGGFTTDAVAMYQRAANLDRRDGVEVGVADSVTIAFLLRFDV